ncbi:MAG TPA: DUF58 domain-containing protein [Rhizomicrobium sp.]|nr:DUF58 domain-containing protein [Rhizomicrobium sp.]
MTQTLFNGARASLQDEAEALSSTLPPLMVEAERLASAVSIGIHGRRKAGIGESFWQFRRFRAEDPSTAIDWRQSAKSQHLFVREREWEVAQSVWFWRDGSPGMRFKSGTVTKLDRASLLALALASALVRGGERIALLGEPHAPASSRVALRRMGHALSDVPAAEPLPPNTPLSRNAQFVWFSDFLSPLTQIEAVLRRMTQSGSHGYLVHIIDPAEEDFPYEGRTRFEAPGGDTTETLGRAETVAPAYKARFKAHAETVALLASKLGWNYLAHRTDRSPQTALIALYAGMSGARHSRM